MAFYQHSILDIFMIYGQNVGLGLGQGSKASLRTPDGGNLKDHCYGF